MKTKQLICALLCVILLFANIPSVSARAAERIWNGGSSRPPGAGTSLSPYQISTGEELRWFAVQVNSGNTGIHAFLMDDIVLNDTSDWESWADISPANHWTPIGSQTNMYKGDFDGRGKTISGVYINSEESYQGLFGYIGNEGTGTIRNVKLESSYIKGNSYVGGICGNMGFFSAIGGCESGATVVGSSFTGGITGNVSTRNVQLSDCRNTGSITGGNSTGGIAGSSNGTITKCVNQGSVGGSGTGIGGLVGTNYWTMLDAYNNGNVSASGYYIGGICGTNGSDIARAYNTGTVTGGWPVCGFAIQNSSLENVYYSGSTLNNGIGGNSGSGAPVHMSAEQFASGEVAYMMRPVYGQTLGPGGDPLPVFRTSDDSNAVYRLIYMSGEAEHASRYYNAGAAVSATGITPPVMVDVLFSHWEDLPETMPANDAVVNAAFTFAPPQISTASPLNGATHAAFNVQIHAAGTAPISYTVISGDLPAGLTLNGETGEITGTPEQAGESTVTVRAENDYGSDEEEFTIIISDEMPGSGTSGEPYEIWTASHLIEFAEKVNTSTNTRYYAVLMADIALNDTGDWKNWGTAPPANTWTPIGISSEYSFKGGFDGGNHTISGVYIGGSGDGVGLFGYTRVNTIVKNINLESSYIAGNESVGGICGDLALSGIENCRSAAIVNGEKYVGGICGYVNSAGSIQSCQNEGTVTGNQRAGGISGINIGTIGGCRNSGTVQGGTSGNSIGGICGISTGDITDAYNTGSVSGNHNIGGICGILNGMTADAATLSNVYNIGSVEGPSNSSAICGATNVYCSLTGCYYLFSSAVGGIGYNAGDFSVMSQDAEQFASGKIAYLLGNAFGQTLGADAYPAFRTPDDGNAVYRLDYMNNLQQHEVQYYNAGNAVSAAGVSAPTLSGHFFTHWNGLPEVMPAEDVSVSAVFQLLTVPDAPRDLAAMPGDGQVVLSWRIPADNGGAEITKYQVSWDCGESWTDSDSGTGHTVTGLINGQSYTFRVCAVNEKGQGGIATVSATPQEQIIPVTSVTVKTAPTKTIYTQGEALDLAGLSVTLHKSDSSTEDVALADFEARGISASPANGSVLTVSNTSVTITYTADSRSVSQSITVNPVFVHGIVSPDTGSFDKYVPADVLITVIWGSTAGITDIRAGGISIGLGNYSVSGNELTIKKEYLASQPAGSIVLTVVFDAGSSASMTITVSDTTPPDVNPATHIYDISSPGDVTAGISWNSASSVTNLAYSVSPDTTMYSLNTGDYAVAGDTMTILSGFFSTYKTGTTLDFIITLNTGHTASLSVNVEDGYVPSSNANLSGLFVNGEPVSGFASDVTSYDVVLPYGWSFAAVTAAVQDPMAGCVITDAAALPGIATVTVTAEDKTTIKAYTINFTIGPPPFVAVTSITGVPAEAAAGAPLVLTGTVEPEDATNRTIMWSVRDAGKTGAVILGNRLLTTGAGIVTVRATVPGGLSESSEYTQDFDIAVSAATGSTHTVTFISRGSIYAVKTVAAGESIGSEGWPFAPVRSGYIFGGWYTGENGTGTRFTSATPVNAAVIIYAKWTYGEIRPVETEPAYEAHVRTGDGIRETLPVTVDKSGKTAGVDAGMQSLSSGGTVITIPGIPGVDTYCTGIPVSELSTEGEQGTLTLETAIGGITVASNMLTGAEGIEGNRAEISLSRGDRDSLPDEVREAIGDRPLIELALIIDGSKIGWSNPASPVRVSIPYVPTAQELLNPGSIVIWYIDGSGNVIAIPNGRYDAAEGTVAFEISHFSKYAVTYSEVSFSDVSAEAWYHDAVSFIAAREITLGTGSGKYSPEAKLTRGEFIVLMMRACEIAPDEDPADNFADAGNTWYTGYLAAAKRLGISAGVGINLYRPDKEITRQEMFTLMYNGLSAIGRLSRSSSGRRLSDFADAEQIAPWAEDAMAWLVESGIIAGSGGKLSPRGTATRAEVAQMLYNLLAE